MRNKDGIKNCCIQVTGFLDCFCSIGNAEKSSAPAGPSRCGRDIETLRKNLCARKLLFRIKGLRFIFSGQNSNEHLMVYKKIGGVTNSVQMMFCLRLFVNEPGC